MKEVSETFEIIYDDNGLVPVVCQEISSGIVLMVAYANAEAVEKTVETGEAHFFSRSRNRLWKKGETSGNILRVCRILVDCDSDTLLYRVEPAGPACHTGHRSCFYRDLHRAEPEEQDVGPELFSEIEAVLEERKKKPEPGSYTAKLLLGDGEKVREKIGEEAFELVLASEKEDPANIVEEASDVIFHTLVLLHRHGFSLMDVLRELKARRGVRRSSKPSPPGS
ncbi:MAG: bifunctional phosphoribosyl-AMP cyclohydrolase/phosphoribosyl-ATP diphosphatase HisIE [Candidatus Hydrogenedentota bacterium]|nr:MAG: bifunctional phosphoribosyl-AMP cyclohydrolase/phosphoribosyl-ATP diphosphatase HisIE [Candidatus Hydrogenedentota bacterium]